MKSLVHAAIAGVIAAAVMVMLQLMLTQQPALAVYHYPSFGLSGSEGLHKLAMIALFGAGYAVAYSLILKALLPGGLLIGSLALAIVPTLVTALVLPLASPPLLGSLGLTPTAAAIKDPWTLLWLFAHWFFYALCLVFIAGGKGGKKGGGGDD